MKLNLRPLSAYSYAALLRLKCPCITSETRHQSDRIKAASIWHYVHTADIDALERMDDDELAAAATRHGYTISPALLRDMFDHMAGELNMMNAAFVETEEDESAPFPGAATSQTSQPA